MRLGADAARRVAQDRDVGRSDTGTVLALISAVLQITGWGFVAGLRSGGTLLRAGLLGAVQGTLGVALLALERLIH